MLTGVECCNARTKQVFWDNNSNVFGSSRDPSSGAFPCLLSGACRGRIEPIEVISGSLPRRQQRLVEAWAELHQPELIADWDRLQAGQTPFSIEPLR